MSPNKVNPQKSSTVSHLKDLLSQSKSVAVVDYSGLKVPQATQLRQDIKNAGGIYLVAKNTLFKIALSQTPSRPSDTPNLEGLSGFVFSLANEVSALKAAAAFSKKNSVLSFKSGLLGDRQLSADEVTQLASLPDRPTLLAKTATSLNSPLFHLAYNLNWNISKLVRTLDAVKQSKI